MIQKMKSPFMLLAAFIFAIGIACNVTGGSSPTDVPPTDIPISDPQPTNAPPPTDVPPTNAPPPTEAVEPPTEEVVADEAPPYYIEEFEGDFSFYPDEYFYWVQRGADNVSEIVSLDRGAISFDIDSRNTWIYIYYGAWIYEDVRIGVEADNLGANSQSVSLFCRYDPERGWIEFNIAGDGTYNIFAYDNSNGYNLLFNGGSTAINIGKQINTYIAECVGDELTLFINGTEVRKLTIPNAYRFLREGYVGFSASSFESLPVMIDIEWFGIELP